MIKNILALIAIVVIGACSSGGSDTPADSTTGTGGGSITPPAPPGSGNGNGGSNVGGVIPVGGGDPPVAGTKAGTYTGDAGAGQGVYVVNNDNFLAGMALLTNGSAKSLFGELGEGNTFNGSLRSYTHQESRPDGAAGSFGSVAARDTAVTTTLTTVNGVSITGPGISLVGASAGQLTTANAASLAGTWQGTHGFCGITEGVESCDQLVTTLVFNGVTVTGNTLVTGGEPVSLEGGITEFGETALISFLWGGNTYAGVVFFVPDGTGRIAFLGESPGSDPETISGLLAR